MAAIRRSFDILNVPGMLGESNFTMFCQIIAGTGINTVLYSRKMFPVRSFKTSFLNAVDVQILQKNYSDPDITDFNDALRGVFEAIGKCYVQQLAVVLLPKDDRYSIYEKFVFNMNYNTHKFEIIGATGVRTVILDNTDLNKPNLIPEIFTKIKDAINVRRLDVLPADTTPSIFMTYYEEYTPTLYQPEGFFDCNTMDYAFLIKSLRVNLGKISTTFTPMRYQITDVHPSTSLASYSENKFGSYARQMITVVINHILYTRRVFPPNCFSNILYGDVVQVLERDCLNNETICDRVIELFRWILGIVDAVEKGYLRQLVIAMAPKHQPHSVYEYYVMILNYHLFTLEIIGATNKVATKITLDDMEGEILCSRVIQLMESGLKATSLGLLPEDAEPSIFLTYYDNITPTIYQPYGFYKNHIEKFPFLIEAGNSVNAKLSSTVERVYENITPPVTPPVTPETPETHDRSDRKSKKKKQKTKKSKKDLKKKKKNKMFSSAILSIIKQSSSHLSEIPDIKTKSKKKSKKLSRGDKNEDEDIASARMELNEPETSTTCIDLDNIASTSEIRRMGKKRRNTSEPKKKTSKKKKVDPDIHNIPSTSASADASKALGKSSSKKKKSKKAIKKQKTPKKSSKEISKKIVQERLIQRLPSGSSTDTACETSNIPVEQQNNEIIEIDPPSVKADDTNVICSTVESISPSTSKVTDLPHWVDTNLLSNPKNVLTLLVEQQNNEIIEIDPPSAKADDTNVICSTVESISPSTSKVTDLPHWVDTNLLSNPKNVLTLLIEQQNNEIIEIDPPSAKADDTNVICSTVESISPSTSKVTDLPHWVDTNLLSNPKNVLTLLVEQQNNEIIEIDPPSAKADDTNVICSTVESISPSTSKVTDLPHWVDTNLLSNPKNVLTLLVEQQNNEIIEIDPPSAKADDTNVICSTVESISPSTSKVTDLPHWVDTNLLSNPKNVVTLLNDMIDTWSNSANENEASVTQLNTLPTPTGRPSVNTKAYYKMYYNSSSPPRSNQSDLPSSEVQNVQSSLNTESNISDRCLSPQSKIISNLNKFNEYLAMCDESIRVPFGNFEENLHLTYNTESVNISDHCLNSQSKDDLVNSNLNTLNANLAECDDSVNETPDKFVLDVHQSSVNSKSNIADPCLSPQPEDQLINSNLDTSKANLAECDESVNETPEKFVLDVHQSCVNTESNIAEPCLSPQPEDQLKNSNLDTSKANLAECDESVNQTPDKLVLDVHQSSVNTESNIAEPCLSPQPEDQLINSNLDTSKVNLAECDETINIPLDKLAQNAYRVHPSVNAESNILDHSLNPPSKDQLANTNLNTFTANLVKCDDNINVSLSNLVLNIQPSLNTESNTSDHCLSSSSKDKLSNSNLGIFKQDSAECNENINVPLDNSVQNLHQPSINTALNISAHCLSPESQDILLTFNLDWFNQDLVTCNENVNVSFDKVVQHEHSPDVNTESNISDHSLGPQTTDQLGDSNLDKFNKDSTKFDENLNVPLGKFEMFNQIFYDSLSVGYNVSQSESEHNTTDHYDSSSISLDTNCAYTIFPFSSAQSDFNQMNTNETALNIQSAEINLQNNDSSCSNLEIMETNMNNSDLNVQSNTHVINNETALHFEQEAVNLQNNSSSVQENYFIRSDANNPPDEFCMDTASASTSQNINEQDNVLPETFYSNIKSNALVIQDNRNELYGMGATGEPAWADTLSISMGNEPASELETVSNVHVNTIPLVSTDNRQNDSGEQSDLSIKNKPVMNNSDIETWCTAEAINDIENITLEEDYGSILSVTFRDSWKAPTDTLSGDDNPSYLRPLTPTIPNINVEDINSDLERPVTPTSNEDNSVANETTQEETNSETESETDSNPFLGLSSSGYTSTDSTNTESEIDEAQDTNIIVNCYCPTKRPYHVMIQCFVCETWQHAMCYAFLDLLPKPGHTFLCSHCLHSFTFTNADSSFVQLPIDHKYELAWFHRCINYTRNKFFVTTEQLFSDLEIPLVLQTPMIVKLVREGVLRVQPNKMEYEVREIPHNFYNPRLERTLRKIDNLEKDVNFIREFEMVYLDENLSSPVLVDDSESE